MKPINDQEAVFCLPRSSVVRILAVTINNKLVRGWLAVDLASLWLCYITSFRDRAVLVVNCSRIVLVLRLPYQECLGQPDPG